MSQHHAQIWSGASLTEPLRHFADASGLVLSLYDGKGQRICGPHFSSRVATLLSHSSLWSEGGAGYEFERHLAGSVLTHRSSVEDAFMGALRVSAMPLVCHATLRGVVVYGWTFQNFSSAGECELIGRALGVSGHALWSEVRLEQPMSDARLATFRALLRSVIAPNERECELRYELFELHRSGAAAISEIASEVSRPIADMAERLVELGNIEKDMPPIVGEIRTKLTSNVDQLLGVLKNFTGNFPRS